MPQRLDDVASFTTSIKIFSPLPLLYFHDITNFLLFLHFYSLDNTTSRLLYTPLTPFFVSSLVLQLRIPSKPQRLLPLQDQKGNIRPITTALLQALGKTHTL